VSCDVLESDVWLQRSQNTSFLTYVSPQDWQLDIVLHCVKTQKLVWIFTPWEESIMKVTLMTLVILPRIRGVYLFKLRERENLTSRIFCPVGTCVWNLPNNLCCGYLRLELTAKFALSIPAFGTYLTLCSVDVCVQNILKLLFFE
jgi:hypothetical protein